MERLEAGDSADSALLALKAGAGAPIWLHLLVADRCNHTCLHCYQVQGLKGELSREQIESLLREFRAGGGFIVSFSGGEATLRDDLVPLLSFAHELGLVTILYTNGFSMTEELASAIAACHVWRVEISIHSDRPEEHDALTGVPGSWAKATQGVRWLRQKLVNVILKFTPTSRSSANAERLADFARGLDSHLMVGELVSAGEAGRMDPTRVRPEAAKAIGPTANADLHFANGLDTKPCGAGELLNVRSDGQIQPCAQLSVPMGSVVGDDAQGIARVGQSEVAQFFKQVTWADFPACRECDLRVHCRRCFASAAAEAGDMLAPYRGACELAVARYHRFTGKGQQSSQSAARSEVDGDATLGPYRVDSNGNLQRAKERRTPYDRALVDRYPWLRPSPDVLQSEACSVEPARRERGLIQLRRAPSQVRR